MHLTFSAKDGFKNGETTIVTFSNIEGGDGDNLYHAIDINKTITKEKENPKTGMFISIFTISLLTLGSIVIINRTHEEKKFL